MAPANGQPRLTGRCGLRSLLAFEVLRRRSAAKLRGNRVDALAAPATVNGYALRETTANRREGEGMRAAQAVSQETCLD